MKNAATDAGSVRCSDIASMKVYKKGAWTLEEEAKLSESVQKLGTRL
jgi:hypothetical protein